METVAIFEHINENAMALQNISDIIYVTGGYDSVKYV